MEFVFYVFEKGSEIEFVLFWFEIVQSYVAELS